VVESNGKYISFLDSDDKLHADYLEVTISELQDAQRDCVGVFTSFEKQSNDYGTIISTAPDRIISYDEIRKSNVIGGFSCTTFISSVFTDVGYLDESLAASQDYDFYLRVLRKYTMLGVDRVLVSFRSSGDAISKNIDRKVTAKNQIVKKHGKELTKKRISEYNYTIGLMFAERGNMSESIIKIGSAICEYPYKISYYYHLITALFGHKFFKLSMKLKILFNTLYHRYTQTNK
jgi:hypothetical protein